MRKDIEYAKSSDESDGYRNRSPMAGLRVGLESDVVCSGSITADFDASVNVTRGFELGCLDRKQVCQYLLVLITSAAWGAISLAKRALKTRC